MKRTKYSIWMILTICVFMIGCSTRNNVDKEITPSKILIYNEAKECLGEMIMDDYGNITKTALAIENDGIINDSTTEYAYDKSGNILKKQYQSETQSYTEEHAYDKSGNIVKTSFQGEYPSFNRSYTDEFKHDEYGNVTYQKHTEDSNDSVTEYVYTYEGEQIKTCETLQDGQPISETEYTYDVNGNVIKSYTSLSNGKVINIIENEYDQHNNRTKTTTTIIVDSIEQVTSAEYDNEYDNDSKIIRTTQYIINNGERQFTATYEYIYE